MHAILGLVILALNIYQWLIIIRLALTWFPQISPSHPAVRMLASIVDPFLRPFRKLLPLIGGLDLSPLIAIIVVTEAARIVGVIDVYVQLREFFGPAEYSISTLALDIVRDVVHRLLTDIIVVLALITLVRVVLNFSGASPWHPFSMTIRGISDPLVRPFNALVGTRRDFAPVAAFVFWVALYLLVDQILFKRIWT